MITPDKKKPKPRVKRSPPDRKGPDRSGKASAKAAKAAKARSAPAAGKVHAHAFGQGTDRQEADFDESVSQFVKSSYDALAETIAQGRKAAEQFRHGEYNFRQVPSDVEELARRMLHLARQLSGTTFDICEQLLEQLSDLAEPPRPGTTKVDPFRRHTRAGETGAAPPSSTAANGAGEMRLAVEFSGRKGATSPTTSIGRPAKLTRPEQLKATPLAPVEGTATPIGKVEFSADLSQGGVIAKVTVPPRQAGGTYVGYIHVEGDKTPLGMLVVKLGK